MKHKFTNNGNNRNITESRRKKQLKQRLAFVLCLVFSGWLVFNTITLLSVSSRPVDAFFVLGGSIYREIYVSELAPLYPHTPILISHGSPDHCILRIFQQQPVVSLQNVWLEKCADSTFGNFYYSIPILRNWRVHKVKLITSHSHLPRAKWMAQILLGAHGIWVETSIIQERGTPGNHESQFKTLADLTRSLLWAGLSQFIQPQCPAVYRLADVNTQASEFRNFKCENHADIRSSVLNE
jgi:uncharacterized SAM-binding protein YcdF (DUF218 family)